VGRRLWAALCGGIWVVGCEVGASPGVQLRGRAMSDERGLAVEWWGGVRGLVAGLGVFLQQLFDYSIPIEILRNPIRTFKQDLTDWITAIIQGRHDWR